jgi:beta-glucosidase
VIILKADISLAALGESAEMTMAASSYTLIGTPKTLKDLLYALISAGKPIVLMLFTESPLPLKCKHEHVS